MQDIFDDPDLYGDDEIIQRVIQCVDRLEPKNKRLRRFSGALPLHYSSQTVPNGQTAAEASAHLVAKEMRSRDVKDEKEMLARFTYHFDNYLVGYLQSMEKDSKRILSLYIEGFRDMVHTDREALSMNTVEDQRTRAFDDSYPTLKGKLLSPGFKITKGVRALFRLIFRGKLKNIVKVESKPKETTKLDIDDYLDILPRDLSENLHTARNIKTKELEELVFNINPKCFILLYIAIQQGGYGYRSLSKVFNKSENAIASEVKSCRDKYKEAPLFKNFNRPWKKKENRN